MNGPAFPAPRAAPRRPEIFGVTRFANVYVIEGEAGAEAILAKFPTRAEAEGWQTKNIRPDYRLVINPKRAEGFA